jgi:hypothetical protein
MKKVLLFLTLMLSLSEFTRAQKMKLASGNLAPIAKEKSIKIEFTYENMRVGKFDKESDYVSKRTKDFNEKESGRGDGWAQSWVNDRDARFEPKFRELYQKYSGMETGVSTASTYTIILHTTFTEPGWNVGVMRAYAQINAVATVVETANPTKKIAEITIDKALGRDFWGADFDTGMRIQEAYADAGKALGKFIKNKID